MSPSPYRSLVGVLLGFICVFPLFIRRPKKTPTNDADSLLAQAQRQLAEAQARNRERAVRAITQKNILQAQRDQTQKVIARLTERLEVTQSSEDTPSRGEMLAERDKYIKMLPVQQASLSSAVEAAEVVKDAMRQEEQRIRQLTAEALALGAQEKQAHIELEIARSRLAMTTTRAADLFVQARKKVEQTKTRRSLMVSIVQATEALDEAANEAEHTGNQDLYRKLTEAREALAKSASNTALWEE